MESESKKNLAIIAVLAIIIIGIIGVFILREYKLNEEKKNATNSKIEDKQENKEEKTNTKNEKEKETVDNIDYVKLGKEALEKPKKGETIAIINVKNFGEIKLKFYKEEAPKAVENFLTHAKNGYYNGQIFHRVINEFMIQGGDPTGTGTGGESIWKEAFGKEVSLKRFPFRGSLAMASVSGVEKSLGSQFFITQAKYKEQIYNQLKLANAPESILKVYKEYGGYPSLFLQYTVFGQVYEGMDVVDKIAAVETNEANDKPKTDVVIENIVVKEAE